MSQSVPSALDEVLRHLTRNGLLADAQRSPQPHAADRIRFFTRAWLIGSALIGWNCDQAPSPTPGHALSASPSEAVPSAQAELGRSETGRVTLKTSTFQAGTEPGSWDRVPELEPTTFDVKLGEFAIDQFAYPNQVNTPPLLGQSQGTASRLCGEAGGRLCTELEWERACRGTDGSVFSTGTRFDCATRDCSTREKVFNMGRAPEWTASFFVEPSKLASSPVVKGAYSGENESSHRCARRAAPVQGSEKQMAFRCCYGAPNAAKVQEPTLGAPYSRYKLTGKELKALLEADERTKELSTDLTFFADPEATKTVLSRGPGDRQGFDFTVEPLIWRPVAGAEFLVVVAKSKRDTSFVLAYHRAANSTFKLASSFIMRGEPGPVVIAYSDSIRPRLHFSSCWGCPGETAKLLYRHPDKVIARQP